MKVIVDKDIPFIEGRIIGADVVAVSGESITKHDVADAHALIVRTRTRCHSSLLEGSKVRMVATATIGTDHIDIPWCEKNGITVTSAPGCNAPGVAQYALSALLNAGFQPESHILGIVGFGNVGQMVAQWATEIGIHVMICDPPRKDAGMTDVTYHDLETVLKNCNAVTLHIPLTQEGKYPTYHMIGPRQLELMPEESILVNSSRGGVVDEKALKDFIKAGKLRGIVDVWENEPAIDRELLQLVDIGTPHIAGYSYEGKKRGTLMVLEALHKELGIEVNTVGLECNPSYAGKKISAETITASYDPAVDSIALKQNPEAFETLRNNYRYRHEPS